jgi:hypothetical protein
MSTKAVVATPVTNLLFDICGQIKTESRREYKK